MYETPNKVLAAAGELGFDGDAFRQVGPAQWGDVLKRVFERFATTNDTGVTWLWSHLKSKGVSVQAADGLFRLAALCPREMRVWLLIEDFDRTRKHGNYWVFEGSFGAVIDTLNNMHGLEYYIVDRRLDWMVLENHHDTLIGVGELVEKFLLKLDAS